MSDHNLPRRTLPVMLFRIMLPVSVAVWSIFFYRGIADFGLSSALYPRLLIGLMLIVIVPAIITSEVKAYVKSTRQISRVQSPSQVDRQEDGSTAHAETAAGTTKAQQGNETDAKRSVAADPEDLSGHWLRVGIALLLLFAWAYFLRRFGFIVATGVVYFGLAITFMGLTVRGAIRAAIASIVFLGLAVLLFDILLGIPLPSAPRG